MQERRVAGSGGITLRVREWGEPDAPTVVLVHGYPDTSEVWDPVAARLESRFHVVAYDVRGAGQSEPGQAHGGYGRDRLVGDLQAVIDATTRQGSKVHLVAHDWGSIATGWGAVTGGVIADRIASYTTLAGPSMDHVGHWVRDRWSLDPQRLAQLANQAARSWYFAWFHLPAVPDLVWRHGLDRLWPAMMRVRDGVKSSPGYPGPTLGQDASHGLGIYRANTLGGLRHPDEGRTEIPVQLIVPTRDSYLSPSLYDGVAERVPNLWRRTIDAGHWAHRTHPEVLARWVAEFAEHVETGVQTPGLRRARTLARAGADRPFQGRLVLITGAGSGIGRETALAFAELGAEVVAVDLNETAARRTAELAGLLGPAAHAYGVDVADAAAMEDLAKTVEREHGVPHVVVNNAGIAVAGPFLATADADWEKVIGVNLWGVIHGCRLFAAMMAEHGEGGHIVNVASAAAYLPSRTLAAYCTSKAAVLMLSECMRADLAGAGIKVSAICPGIVNTNITRSAHYVGVDKDAEARRQDKVSGLYKLRNFTPDRVARQIVRAVQDNAAVVPVTVEAKALQTLGRISPAALRALARLDPLPH